MEVETMRLLASALAIGIGAIGPALGLGTVSYTHLRAHET